MFVAQFISALGFSIIFPFIPLYIQWLGTNTSLSTEFLSGMVYSGQALTMMIAAPFWGLIADRYGRKLMVQRAAFGGAIIILGMGFVRSAEELVLLRSLQGLVTGVVSAASALVASVTPRHRTGYAMGILQLGFWSGLAVGPLTGGILSDLFGYRNTFIVTSALLIISGVLVWIGVEESFVPPPKAKKRRYGFLSDWKNILSSPGVMIIYALRFFGNLARMMVFPIIPLFIQTIFVGTTRVNTFTGLVVGLASATSTATGVYLGRLGDRIGHKRILTMSALAAGLLYLPQSLVAEAWQLLILQALTGAAAGGIIPSIGALLAGYTRPGEEGSVYGLDSSITSASRAVAPLVGAGVAHWFSLRGTFGAAGIVFLFAALLAAWRLPLRIPQKR